MTRALEVAKISGRPLSHWQTQFERFYAPEKARVFVLGWERSMLHQRVERRVHAMFERGLLDEVQSLLARHESLSRTAMQAVGYKEPIEYLKGHQSLDETLQQVIIHTRQFVRRQEMWFRSLEEIKRIEIQHEEDLQSVADRILAQAV